MLALTLTPTPPPEYLRRARGFQSPIGAQDASSCSHMRVALLELGNLPASTLACHPELVEGSRLLQIRGNDTSPFACHPEPAGEGSRPSLEPGERIRGGHDARTGSCKLPRCVTRDPSTSLRMTHAEACDLDGTTLHGERKEFVECPRPCWPRKTTTFTAAHDLPCTMAGRNEILRQAQDDILKGAPIITADAHNRAPLSCASTSREGLGVRALAGVRTLSQ
jgi:hypothetical protein